MTETRTRLLHSEPLNVEQIEMPVQYVKLGSSGLRVSVPIVSTNRFLAHAALIFSEVSSEQEV